jgi:hypothetical protein
MGTTKVIVAFRNFANAPREQFVKFVYGNNRCCLGESLLIHSKRTGCVKDVNFGYVTVSIDFKLLV